MKPRNKKELDIMRESGKISGLALKKVMASIKEGVSALELEEIATNEIKKLGAESSFKTVRGYKWTTCITFNEQVVHGIPTERRIKNGDVVSVDLGAVLKGWHTDTAWSTVVGSDPEKEKFLKIGEEALWLGIEKAIDGNKVGDIGHAIQTKVEEVGGYSIVRSLVGHGVGRSLHEAPEVPGYGKAGTGPILKEGMTIAIEVIYNEGSEGVILDKDGWTISSEDGSLAGLFEMTVIVGSKKAEVLTYNLESGRIGRL